VASLVVVAVFATVGDGLPASGDGGLRGVLVDHAHLATWVLLAAAFAVAAARGRWTSASTAFAAAGGVLYAAFLLAVVVGG
jgi:hypothetical protein